jgi:hypothetical protein
VSPKPCCLSFWRSRKPCILPRRAQLKIKHHLNEDPVHGCQIGTKSPILYVK